MCKNISSIISNFTMPSARKCPIEGRVLGLLTCAFAKLACFLVSY
jgi:hypothetical protein